MKKYINRITDFFRLFQVRLFLIIGTVLTISGCEKGTPAESLKDDIASCWPCSLYKTAFDAIGKATTALYETTTSLGLTFLGFGLLFYLAFASLKLVSSFKEPNLKKDVIAIIHVLFKAMLAAVVLSVPVYFLEFLDMVITPVILGFIKLSHLILLSGATWDPAATGFILPEAIAQEQNSFPLFSGEVSYQVQDIIYRIYMALKSGMGLGGFIFAEGTFISFIVGFAVILLFFSLMLIFPFTFVDSFLRIGVAVLLAPFLIAAWPFPKTKDWLSKGFNMVVGALFTLLFSCIFIGLLVSVITTYTDQILPGAMGNTRQTMDPNTAAAAQEMAPGVFSFLILLYALSVLASRIAQLAQAFGGDGSGNDLVGFLGGLKQLAINMATIAAGAALTAVGAGAAGKKLMEKGVKDLKKQGKDTMKSAIGVGADGKKPTKKGAKDSKKQGGAAAPNTKA